MGGATAINDAMTTLDHYVSAFESFAANGASGSPGWLRDARKEAISRFATAGFPTTRQEAWRLTDVKSIVTSPFALAPVPEGGEVSAETVERSRIARDIPVAVFVNGYFVEGLSKLEGLSSGVSVGSLAKAISTAAKPVEAHLTRHVQDDENPFVALNGAFLADGAFVHIDQGAVVGPVQLLFISLPSGEAAQVSHPRVLVVAEKNAQATLVETYTGVGVGAYWTNTVSEVVLAANARVEMYRIQDESTTAFHTAGTYSDQERDSVLKSVMFSFGSRLSRYDVRVVLSGEGAESTLNGLLVLSDRQHVDYHTTLDHASAHCNSWEYFNGIVGGRARAVFNGRIIVRPGAQKTDAKQTNNNLLLSSQARADSQPQLRIFADDVRCTHGATLGPIDEAHLFYLQSRGLKLNEARMLLAYGFASEILGGVELEPLRQRLDGMIRGRIGVVAGGE